MSVGDAQLWLNNAILNFHAGRNSVHFIISEISGKLIGIIDLIPPVVIKEHYQLKEYSYFIEFYLDNNMQGRSIMSKILPPILSRIKQEGIVQLGAVVNRKNFAASRVLEKSGFIYQKQFDVEQDLFQLKATA